MKFLLCVCAFLFVENGLLAQKPDPLNADLKPPVENPGQRKLTAYEQSFLAAAAPANNSSSAKVWITSSMVKVQPGTPPDTANLVDLTAARNEFESFQVHVHAATTPIQLNVTMGDLVNTQTGKTIPANPNITVFREAYLNVRVLSDLNGTGGQMPDALIPAKDPYLKQQRNAFPVTIPAGQNRSAWVDIYVPQNTPSGYYLGRVTVFNGNQVISQPTVRLKVWNFSLPSTASLKSAFGLSFLSFAKFAYPGNAGLAQYPGTNGNADNGLPLIHADVATMFLDHRVTISALPLQPTYTGNNTWSNVDPFYGPLFSGTAKTILPGAKVTTVQYPNATLGTFDAADVKAWMDHFRSKNWTQTLFQGECDEPPAGCGGWDVLKTRATNFQNAGTGMPVMVTTNIDLATKNNVVNLIDILTPVLDHVHSRYDGDLRSTYDDWVRKPGKQLWWYQSCDQHEQCGFGGPGPKTATWPSYMIDATPVRNRVFQWMAYLYRISGELYYATDMWTPNPWDEVFFAGGNGDGVLYYPGTVDKVGGTAPIAIPSLRLKLIREGMEDYEYLNALSKAGYAGQAQAAARTFITNAYTFNNNPAALLGSREKLGTMLHRLSIGLPVQ